MKLFSSAAAFVTWTSVIGHSKLSTAAVTVASQLPEFVLDRCLLEETSLHHGVATSHDA